MIYWYTQYIVYIISCVFIIAYNLKVHRFGALSDKLCRLGFIPLCPPLQIVGTVNNILSRYLTPNIVQYERVYLRQKSVRNRFSNAVTLKFYTVKLHII